MPGYRRSVGVPGNRRLERPEQAAAAIGAARPGVGVGIVAKPKVMASVEVVGRAAATEAAIDGAVAVMDLDGAFAGRNAVGMTGAKRECIA